MSFDMIVPNIEVKDIIRMDEIRYRMKGWNKKPMGKTKVIVTINYTVDAALSNK
jgi:4-alpha-glucanotransferase